MLGPALDSATLAKLAKSILPILTSLALLSPS
jgi:hypothetical protein